MNEFEKILQECLRDLEQGASNVDECLSRHPQYAQELEPILHVATCLERASEMPVTDVFKSRVRARLVQDMRLRPRKPVPARAGFAFARLAVGFAALLLAMLATGTVYAQRALPGEAFYRWKLASENAWRIVSSDPVETDLKLADRRVQELKAVKDDPELRSQALEAYLETATRLRSEVTVENESRVLEILDSHVLDLNRSGILPQPPEPREDAPILTPPPAATPSPALPILRPDSTDLPQVLPTLEVPPEILPTIESPLDVLPPIELPIPLPTVEIPLPIP